MIRIGLDGAHDVGALQVAAGEEDVAVVLGQQKQGLLTFELEVLEDLLRGSEKLRPFRILFIEVGENA